MNLTHEQILSTAYGMIDFLEYLEKDDFLPVDRKLLFNELSKRVDLNLVRLLPPYEQATSVLGFYVKEPKGSNPYLLYLHFNNYMVTINFQKSYVTGYTK